MNWRQGVAKMRTFLESMYGMPSYDEEQFRAKIRTLVRPPESQVKGDNKIISPREENDYK